MSEEGFTLAEVMITIVIMGIIFAIATSSWWSVVEARRVDSAANQLASDLRLAHSSATNRLTTWEVVVPAPNSTTYQIGPSGVTLATRTLADGTRIAAATTITFNADGTAALPGGAASSTITVQADDGAPAANIEIAAATSRVLVD